MTHPLFEIVTTTTGAISIRNKAVNEIMHNPVGPWIEANALYIDQSNLKTRLKNSNEEFVIFDVGLGAAANALAALACIDELKQAAPPVRLISFERDLELLRFALQHSSQFEHFSGYEKALEQILERGVWSKADLVWELRHGDFLEQIENEKFKPHLIFFDPYSPRVNEEMWTMNCFKKLYKISRPLDEGGTCLYTYSRATRIRTAMLVAGFKIGYGRATGLKDETTQASTDESLLESPVRNEWFERWQKSHLRYPFDCTDDMKPSVDAAVEKYFRG